MLAAYIERSMTQPKAYLLHVGGASRERLEAVRVDISPEQVEAFGLVLGQPAFSSHPSFQKLLGVYKQHADFQPTFFTLVPVWADEE